VKFFRDSGCNSIDVILFEKAKCISLFKDGIAHCAKSLSETEIEEAVTLLSHEKKAMLKQRNFPPIYDEMLSDLIEVQRVRYGVKKDKKRKLSYSVSAGKLEDIPGQFVQAYSIDVGSDRLNAELIDLDLDHSYLVLPFRKGERTENE
jgi:hypothetical protein